MNRLSGVKFDFFICRPVLASLAAIFMLWFSVFGLDFFTRYSYGFIKISWLLEEFGVYFITFSPAWAPHLAALAILESAEAGKASSWLAILLSLPLLLLDFAIIIACWVRGLMFFLAPYHNDEFYIELVLTFMAFCTAVASIFWLWGQLKFLYQRTMVG